MKLFILSVAQGGLNKQSKTGKQNFPVQNFWLEKESNSTGGVGCVWMKNDSRDE